MFRACLNRCTQTLYHSSSNSLTASTSSVAGFHTSVALRASANKNIKLSKKAKTAIKEERYRKALSVKPSPVLGTRPGEEDKWDSCDLAKVLVDEAALYTPTPTSADTSNPPPVTLHAFGVVDEVADKLLNVLPEVSARDRTLGDMTSDTRFSHLTEGEARESAKEQMFERIIDLRNANAKGIAFENRRRIITAFSTPENPWDTGRVEVQAALLTYRIRSLWSHLLQHKGDYGNRRGLQKLVHQRAKILRYLRRTDRLRYDIILERLALEPESVEGELNV